MAEEREGASSRRLSRAEEREVGASLRSRWRVDDKPGACSLSAEVRDERTERTEDREDESESEERDGR